ncbi:MAG: tetratricopeptide repeat protein [Nitrospirota bacterium]
MKKDLIHKPLIHVLLIIILGFLAYSNTFEVPFVFDDTAVIVKNPIIKDLNYFIEPSSASDFKKFFEYKTFRRRYVGYLTFAMSYKLNGLDVAGYHIANLLIHIANALLVYFFILLSFKTPCLRRSSIKEYSGQVAVIAALLFVTHPIQTQAVTYIWQRVTSLTATFYLLSLLMYVKARFKYQTTESSMKGTGTGLELKPALCYLISIISAVLAMKTKEIAFTLPITIGLFELMFLEGKLRRRVLYLIPFLVAMLIIPLSLVGMDGPVGDLIGDVGEAAQETKDMSKLDYLFTEFRVIVTYIRLIILPANQNLDYDYSIYHSFFNSGVFLSFLLLLSTISLGIYLWCRYRNTITHTRLISFGIFWFFVTLSVESSIIPIRDVINEHRIYLPSIGVFLAIAATMIMKAERLRVRAKSVAAALLVLIVISLTLVTYTRNMVWSDRIKLWEDVINKSPNKYRSQFNLGSAYQDQGSLDKAMEQYRTAIRLKPDFAKAYFNLGIIYKTRGDNDEAMKHFKMAITFNPEFAQAHNNLGNVYQVKGLNEKAKQHFQAAIKHDPYFAEPHYNLATVYRTKGLIDKAIDEYNIAIRLKPDYFSAHYNLGNAYAVKGRFDKAVKHYRFALNIRPDDPDVRNNLGVIYRATGSINKAIEEFLMVIKNKPDWIKPHFSLGRLYLKKGDKMRARKELEEVLKLDPLHGEAKKLYDLTFQSNDMN